MRTQVDRDLDLATGRELERKDAELVELRAEIERLRTTLQKIASLELTGGAAANAAQATLNHQQSNRM